MCRGGWVFHHWMNMRFARIASAAAHPTASVFRGSMGKETFSIRWQVLHSEVRS